MGGKHSFLPVLILFIAATSADAETLSLDACRKAAREKGHSERMDEIAELIHEEKESILRRQYTPRLGFTGEAHFQSDAPDPTGLTDFPFELYKLDKFGYHVGFVVSQSIYRGGTRKIGEELNAIDRDIALQENLSDTYAIENTVDDIYLDAILAGKQRDIAITQREALDRKLKDAENAFEQGSGYKSGILSIEAAIADINATIDAYSARRQSAMAMLSELTGLEIDESTSLELPQAGIPDGFRAPVFQNIDLQLRKLSFEKQYETAKMRPNINAFGTVGYGNWPLNIFKRKPDFFGIVGVTLSIPISSLQDAVIKGEIFDRHSEKLRMEKENLERKQAVENLRYDGEIARIDALITSGETTIAKYEELCGELAKMSGTGLSSTSDYLDALGKLTAARINREVFTILKIRTQLQKNRNLLK